MRWILKFPIFGTNQTIWIKKVAQLGTLLSGDVLSGFSASDISGARYYPCGGVWKIDSMITESHF